MTDRAVLSYEPPSQFHRRGDAGPANYASIEFNASMQIYPFRPYPGDPWPTFRTTLARDLIEPRFRESNATLPTFGSVVVPGAVQALTVHFVETAGLPRQRLRVLIAVDDAVAVIDVAAAAQIWPRVSPLIAAFLQSVRVETA